MAMSENSRSSGNGSFTGLFLVAVAVWLLFFGGLQAVQRATQGYATSGAPVISTIQEGARRIIATPAPVASLPMSNGAPRPASVIATPIHGVAQGEAESQSQYATAVAIGNQGQAVQAQDAPVAAPAVVQPLPTAAIMMPTAVPVAQVRVIPLANVPIVYAPGSDMRPTALPTLVYPTPLTEGKDWTLSADGLCVRAPRNGKVYEACQTWKYTQAEAAGLVIIAHRLGAGRRSHVVGTGD